jgi:hypothetical protein
MRIVETAFRDTVSGKMVMVWEDCYGDRYLADSKYGMRVKKE